MLLIHPPLVKPCEPPAGLAKLAGALSLHNIPHRIIDGNVEGILSLLHKDRAEGGCLLRGAGETLGGPAAKNPPDTWTGRAFRRLGSNIASLNSRETYRNIDRYRRAVIDVNRVLEVAASRYDVLMSLANYTDRNFSPVSSADLLKAADRPECNPFYTYFRERFSAVIDEEQPAVVGLSLNYLSQAVCTFAMAGFLRQRYPGLRLILGGGLVTSWVRQPGWSNPFHGLIDELVAGPGEGSLLGIYGIDHREGHNLPDYTALSGTGYMSPGPILPYSTSSGCYWSRCSFCPERAEGNPYRQTPPDRVIKELHDLLEKTRPVLIHLLDNALSPALLAAMAETSFSVPWYGFARISPHLTDMDFCLALKRSGCVMLQLGLESGDQKVLDNMRKGFELETASAALKTLKRAGIATYIYLLFGTPSETITAARKTLDFTVRHSEQIDFLNLAVFNLPAYGPEAGELATSDFYEGDLSLYKGFLHPGGWGRNFVRQFLNGEFRRHPAIASILRKTPPIFTSNHAPFFVKPSP